MGLHVFTEEEANNIKKGYYEEKLSLKKISEKYNIGLKLINRFIKENNMTRENIAIQGGNFIDETGKQYGRLIVIQNLHKKDKDNRNLFLCQCSCGNLVEVSGHHLRSGNTRSCGCLQKEKALETLKTKTKLGDSIGKDLTDLVFGKLTVLQEVDPIFKQNGKPMRQWKCKCECGNEVIVQHTYLTVGDTQSCGCINSQGAIIIDKILKENNINFIREYLEKNLKTPTNYLKFDFAILDKNNQVKYFIEFDGEQHYNIHNYYFSEQQMNNDMRKNEFCLNNNIPLIRIPYSEKDNLNLSLLCLETTKQNYIVKNKDHYDILKELNNG